MDPFAYAALWLFAVVFGIAVAIALAWILLPFATFGAKLILCGVLAAVRAAASRIGQAAGKRGLGAFLLSGSICAVGQAQVPSGSLPADLRRQTNEALRASQAKLRQATINLRDARMKSCELGMKVSCDQAALSNAQLLLLDIEIKYSRRGSEKAQNVTQIANDARQAVSELENALDDY